MRIKKIAAGALAVLLSLLPGCASAQELGEYQNVNPKITGILSVQNGHLTTPEGERVRLYGVNLGGWMLMETWMGVVENYAEDWGYFDTLAVLEERFGAEQTAELVKTYEDNFITEADIAQIEALGMNCVRVPFWYRNFMREDGTWLTESPDENPGFQRLDWLLEQCEAHGIYVILDLHGAPGGQSMNHCTGKAGRNLLYTDEACMESTKRLWTALAERYRERAVVAAYDLLNEPQNNGGYTGDTAWAAESEAAVAHTNAAYDALYKTVRAVDDAHVISFEGIWSTTVLPDPIENGYENMLYQLHLYDTSRGMIDYRVGELLDVRTRFGTAVLVGEFNNIGETGYGAKKYRENEISAVKWTYKTVNVGDSWGIFNRKLKRIDIKTASYEEIAAYFEAELDTSLFTFDKWELHRLSE